MIIIDSFGSASVGVSEEIKQNGTKRNAGVEERRHNPVRKS